MDAAQHFPVMSGEALELLAIRPEGVYVDATCGLGGHTALIAQRLTTGIVIANDRDPASLALARENTRTWADRIRFHHGRFGDLPEAIASAGFEKVDGLLADLGVSRYQLTSPERGFSFMADSAIDMRMDQTTGVPAADLVNYANEQALADIIYRLGGERRARRVARAIVRARPIRSTRHLADVVDRAVPRTSRLEPATKTFMALRAATNEEPEELRRLLRTGPELLNRKGRMVMISFIFDDDRAIKLRFRELAQEGHATLLTKHPLTPSGEEVRANPASRSAKLRAVEME